MSIQFNRQKIFLFQAIHFWQLFLIQSIQFSTSIVFVHTQLNVKTVLLLKNHFSVSSVLMSKTILFLTVQFCISAQFSSICPIDRTLSGATTPGQSRPGSDGNEGLHCIPQSPTITGMSPSDCLVSYPGHFLGRGCYPSTEM